MEIPVLGVEGGATLALVLLLASMEIPALVDVGAAISAPD